MHLLVASGGEAGIGNSPPDASSSVHQCINDWLEHSPSRSYSSMSLVSGGEGASHKCIDEGSSA